MKRFWKRIGFEITVLLAFAIFAIVICSSGCSSDEPKVTKPQPVTIETPGPEFGPWSGKHVRPKFIVDEEPEKENK